MSENTPKVKNPLGMLVMSAIVIAFVGYLYWDTVRLYLAGGENAPSLALVIIGGIVLLAGMVYIGSGAIRIYLREKKSKKDEQD